MKPELWFLAGALLVSGLALVRKVVLQRRQREVSRLERKVHLIEEMFRLETGASVLYSNVLTLDVSEYRKEVCDVIEKLREVLPQFIEEARRIRSEFDETGRAKEKDMVEFGSQVSEFRDRLLSIEQMLQHGLERGKQ